MNRKQAKAQGGAVYERWLAGYVWLKKEIYPYSFDRRMLNELVREYVTLVDSMYTPEGKAYTYGVMSAVKSNLKHGRYVKIK